jgi:hypothetical protein
MARMARSTLEQQQQQAWQGQEQERLLQAAKEEQECAVPLCAVGPRATMLGPAGAWLAAGIFGGARTCARAGFACSTTRPLQRLTRATSENSV